MLTGKPCTTGLCWAIYLLSRHPEAWRKIKDEVRKVTNGALPTFEDISKMDYLSACVQETLRLFPPVPIMTPREAIVDDEVCGKLLLLGFETSTRGNWYLALEIVYRVQDSCWNGDGVDAIRASASPWLLGKS